MAPPAYYKLFITLIALTAFAANSLLCRMALEGNLIAPAEFTAIRLISGAVALWLLVVATRPIKKRKGSIAGALALFTYAACFSYAYVGLQTGIGALLLFGFVQLSMLTIGWFQGERLTMTQWSGVLMAIAGLMFLTAPGLRAPPLLEGSLMALSGCAWGVYTQLGRHSAMPLQLTAGNFLYSVPLALVLYYFSGLTMNATMQGVWLAVASGAIASGLGYAVWYHILPHLKSANAATAQLFVPILAALAGWFFLQEEIGLRFAFSATTILGGIALVIYYRSPRF